MNSRRAMIRDIAREFPKRVELNSELEQKYPHWQVAEATKHTGVTRRYIAAEGETALDLAEQACKQMLQAHPELQQDLDALIFCTQTPDYSLPGNACLLHGRLKLPAKVGAFDVGLACSGFVYSLNLARALVESGVAQNVWIVTAETYSKFIHPEDRSTRLLFSDAAAVTWIAPSEDASGILDVAWGTDGSQFQSFCIPGGAARGTLPDVLAADFRNADQIHMNGKDMMKFTFAVVPGHIQSFLQKIDLKTADIDLFVLHQASALVLDSVTRLLALPVEKVYRNLEHTGNTVSASIPIALYDAKREHRLQPGQRILLSGFGSGLSWGSALLQL